MQRILVGCVLGVGALLGGCAGSSLDAVSNSNSPWGTVYSSSGYQSSMPADFTGDGQPAGGDLYEAVGTNPFTLTAHDPLSTFAADVDTASYDIFRRDIQNYNRLPNPDSVRLEEYVNYFGYDYLAPASGGDHPFHITVERAPSVIDRPTELVRVAIQGELPPDFEKKPANLVFLIDVSGSMQSNDKLPLVKQLLSETLEVLEPEDTVSIVTYASGTGVRLAPTPASNKDVILTTLNNLRAGGSTNGGAGIQLAYEQAISAYRDDGINHVILCSDGDFNVGITGNALVDYIKEQRETGVTFTALGFGAGNLNDAMMENTSNAGNGIYGVISSFDQAINYVHERLLNNLYYIAKDVKIQVVFNPEKVAAYRLLGYENRDIADDDFTDDTVDAGEIGAGHRVTALYEIAYDINDIPMPEGAPALDDGVDYDGEWELDSEEIVQVRVRYKLPEATVDDEAIAMSASLMDVVPEGAGDVSVVDGDLQWAAAVAALAEILKESPFAEMSALDAIQSVLAEHHNDSPERLEFIDLVSKARVLLEAKVSALTE